MQDVTTGGNRAEGYGRPLCSFLQLQVNLRSSSNHLKNGAESLERDDFFPTPVPSGASTAEPSGDAAGDAQRRLAGVSSSPETEMTSRGEQRVGSSRISLLQIARALCPQIPMFWFLLNICIKTNFAKCTGAIENNSCCWLTTSCKTQ